MIEFSIETALAQQASCRANSKVIQGEQEVCRRKCKRCDRLAAFKAGKR